MRNNLYVVGLTALLYGCGNETSPKTGSVPKTESSARVETVKSKLSAQVETPTAAGSSQEVNHNLQNLIGTYAGLVNGIPAEYEVRENSCELTLHLPKRIVSIRDEGCDNKADQVATPNSNYTGNKGYADIARRYKRQSLTRSFEEDVDPWLREGWKLVKPENKVYVSEFKELENLFKP